MKKLFSLVFILLLGCVSLFAQVKKQPFTFPTEQKAIGSGVYQKDSVIKTVSIKIYIGSRGGRYYVIPNKQDNSLWDRKYLKKN